MPLKGLSQILKPSQISTDTQDLQVYGKDWAKHLKPNPLAVVFPTSTDQVRDIVLWARKTKTALVPSGGRTGMSGGATASNGEVLVSLSRMNKIVGHDSIDRTITCQAGVITEQLQNYAQDHGFYYPVDFAARGSSQVGGNVNTNAGGIKVLRYGLTRNWVAGLTVVTGQGQVLHLNNSLVKNATGYDLRHLFIGSEGTLGIVTEVTFQVTNPPKPLTVLLLGVENLDGVLSIYQLYRQRVPVTAYEMFTEEALGVVLGQGHLKRPLAEKAPYYVLVEFEQESAETNEHAMELFEKCAESGWVIDGAVAQTPQQAREFWRLREDISEATAPFEPYKNDISVRVADVTAFLTELDSLIKNDYPDFQVIWFGHIGDGNLHINILKPKNLSSEAFLKKCHEVDQHMFAMIARFKGSISAEHGVGVTKRPYLHFTRSTDEIQLMRGIKAVFDPDGILNPGKLL